MKSSTEYSGTSWCIDLSGFDIINSNTINFGRENEWGGRELGLGLSNSNKRSIRLGSHICDPRAPEPVSPQKKK